MNETTLTHEGAKLTIERVINAPKDKVWDAYTTADLFVKWFSPQGWSAHTKHFDVSTDGYVLYAMKCEDETQTDWFGKETWGKSVYSSVTPKDTFTYRDFFCDEEGNPTGGMPVSETRISFTETDGKTKITSVSTYESEAAVEQVLAMGMEEGIKQTFDKLALVLEQAN
ncbi:MAG: SRPBCC domain-containing protein [Candidatus Saccharimonadales bacterium]